MTKITTARIVDILKAEALSDPPTGWLSDFYPDDLSDEGDGLGIREAGHIDLWHLAEIIQDIAKGDRK